MKTIIFLFAFILSVASFGKGHSPLETAYATKSIMTALQHGSSSEYVSLIPSLQQFYGAMDAESKIYGDRLNEAKAEFAAKYIREIVPVAKSAFEQIIQDGTELGITWTSVNFEHFIHENEVLTVVFSSNGKEYRLSVQTVNLNGKVGVSQFIKLV